MNTRDEIIDALEGHSDGYAPPAVFTQTATVDQMRKASWPEAHFDPVKMAELSLEFGKMFGFATAKVPFCMSAEAETLGCSIDRGTSDRQPSVICPRFPDDGNPIPEVNGLPTPEEYVSGKRCSTVIEAADRIKRSDEDRFVIAGTVDPFGSTQPLFGVERFLMGMLMEPDTALSWVKAVEPLTSEYVRRLSEVSDDVQIITEAYTDILPPAYFDDYIGKPMKKVLRSASGFTTLHTCGTVDEVLGKLASLGETALSVESPEGPEKTMESVKGRTRLIGGIPAVSMLLQGTPQEITESAKRYSDAGYALITPECGVPPRTPGENLMALSGYRYNK